jgi:molecular chaperone DnaK
MARLGIDFGTTNTVAAIHDRGLFSVIHHHAQTATGRIIQEVFPSVILIDKESGGRWFGLEADRRSTEIGISNSLVSVSSLKRQLRNYTEGRGIIFDAADGNGYIGKQDSTFGIAELLTEFLQALADSIRRSQILSANEPLEAVVTWPANANGAQRYVTRKCFRKAGFEVIDTLNEPTAAAIELGEYLTAGRATNKKTTPYAVAVFDLGGGTFDASVVWIDGDNFQVLASAGIEELGGDDFDKVLLEIFLAESAISPEAISPVTRHAMLRQARSQKESISTGVVKSLFLHPRDFGLKGQPITISVDTYREHIRPLLKPAVTTRAEVIQSDSARKVGINADSESLMIYLVGGSSRLPFVAEIISEAFPNSQIVLSDKPFRSIALGAAICAADRVTYRDVFARHFGLIRLKDHGRSETFDIIFPAGTSIPRRGELPIEKVVWYAPAHNIGHLRYLECTSIGPDGMPSDGIRAWSDILFPYDPSYSLSAQVCRNDIVRTDRFSHLAVCEIYRCDSDGVITVEVQNPARYESRCYEIYDTKT